MYVDHSIREVVPIVSNAHANTLRWWVCFGGRMVRTELWVFSDDARLARDGLVAFHFALSTRIAGLRKWNLSVKAPKHQQARTIGGAPLVCAIPCILAPCASDAGSRRCRTAAASCSGRSRLPLDAGLFPRPCPWWVQVSPQAEDYVAGESVTKEDWRSGSGRAPPAMLDMGADERGNRRQKADEWFGP